MIRAIRRFFDHDRQAFAARLAMYAETPKAENLTEADVRRIVREEIAKELRAAEIEGPHMKPGTVQVTPLDTRRPVQVFVSADRAELRNYVHR